MFLAVWIEEAVDSNLWLYAALSDQHLQSLRAGKQDLRNAFLNAEGGVVYQVKVCAEPDSDQVITVLLDQIDLDWLPEAGEFLDWDVEKTPAIA